MTVQIALYTRHELTELSSEALLSFFKHSRDIRVRARVLVGELVAVSVPHTLKRVENVSSAP